MFKIDWFFVSRIAAIVQIFYAIGCACLISYYAVALFFPLGFLLALNHADFIIQLTYKYDGAIYGWILLVLAYFCVTIDLSLGIILFSATKSRCNPIEAKVKVKIWQGMSFVMILLHVFLAIGLGITNSDSLDAFVAPNFLTIAFRFGFLIAARLLAVKLLNKVESAPSSVKSLK